MRAATGQIHPSKHPKRRTREEVVSDEDNNRDMGKMKRAADSSGEPEPTRTVMAIQLLMS